MYYKDKTKLMVSSNVEDIVEMFGGLNDEVKKVILKMFVFEDILGAIEDQLKHKTDWNSWSTDGWIDSSVLRKKLIEIQGLEPEFKKDLESKIRRLEHDVDNYKKYYDWYFKLYHFGYGEDKGNLHRIVTEKIGNPDN